MVAGTKTRSLRVFLLLSLQILLILHLSVLVICKVQTFFALLFEIIWENYEA